MKTFCMFFQILEEISSLLKNQILIQGKWHLVQMYLSLITRGRAKNNLILLRVLILMTVAHLQARMCKFLLQTEERSRGEVLEDRYPSSNLRV